MQANNLYSKQYKLMNITESKLEDRRKVRRSRLIWLDPENIYER
jgi:hypothetical protein